MELQLDDLPQRDDDNEAVPPVPAPQDCFTMATAPAHLMCRGKRRRRKATLNTIVNMREHDLRAQASSTENLSVLLILQGRTLSMGQVRRDVKALRDILRLAQRHERRGAGHPMCAKMSQMNEERTGE